MKFVTYSSPSHNAFQSRDIVVHSEKTNAYTKDGTLVFRVWTNRGKEVRRHCYRCVVFMPSYHERERKTVSGVAKNAVKDLSKALKEGVYKPGQMLILMADGTNKLNSLETVTGTNFLQTVFDQEIRETVERYEIDFATVVTEDSTIFHSHPGDTDVRGKGSQFECALNFIHRVCIPETSDAENIPGRDAHIYFIDSDLSKTEGWIGRLYQGMKSGRIDYAISYFLLYKYNDMITVNFSYPLISALVGVAVRQCMTGIFALNGNFLKELVLHTKWDREWRGYGIDTSILLSGIRNRVRMIQVPQETPLNGVVHYAQEFRMFQQVCSSLFRQFEPFVCPAMVTNEVRYPQILAADPRVLDFGHLDQTSSCCKESYASHYLHFFMSLYTTHDFQSHAEETLGKSLFNKINSVYNKFVASGLRSITDYQTPLVIPEIKALEYGDTLLRFGSETFLSASTWANIVMEALKSFCWLKSVQGIEEAIHRVAMSVLPCVFHLRCLSFIMEAWDLKSYPETEELIKAQRDEFVTFKTVTLGDKLSSLEFILSNR